MSTKDFTIISSLQATYKTGISKNQSLKSILSIVLTSPYKNKVIRIQKLKKHYPRFLKRLINKQIIIEKASKALSLFLQSGPHHS